MAKFKIGIQLIETYNNYVIVDAENLNEAIEKVEKVWSNDDNALYDKTSECMDDQQVRFFKYARANESDINTFDNLDRYEYEEHQI